MSNANAGGLLTPQDLKKLAEEAENARLQELQELLARRRKEAEEAAAAERASMERGLDTGPKALEWLNKQVRHAVEQGRTEVSLLTFPARFCVDHGRAIKNFDPDWADSLTGVALRAYQAFDHHLKPLGYKLRAQVLTYPDGNLVDVGLFLSW